MFTVVHMRRYPGSSLRLEPVPQPPPRQRIVLESAAELRAEIRQLRAENQRLKAELAGSQRTRSAGALRCGYCSATALEYVTEHGYRIQECTDPDCDWQRGEKL